MTAEHQPPALPPGHWVECSLCHEFFRNEQARGSHLHYVHHQASVRKVRPKFEAPTPEASKAAPVVLREVSPVPKPQPRPEPPAPAAPETPKPTPPQPAHVEPAAPPSRPAEVSQASPPASAAKQPGTPAQPTANAKESPATAPAQAPSSSAAEVLTALGISVGSLAALILANKGKNAPSTQAPVQTEPARPPARLPDGIWAQPEPIQPSGIEYVDRMLGHSGLPKPRRRLWG